jgi:hypothetical protein
MWEQMFPGLKVSKINRPMFQHLDYIKMLATLFLHNEGVEKKMVALKFPLKVARQAQFLIDMKNKLMDDENIYALMKQKERVGIDEESIFHFALTNRIPMNRVNKFLQFCDAPRVKGEDLMKDGFKGPKISIEQRRRELDKFKSL